MLNGLIRLYGVKAGRLVFTHTGLVGSNEDLGGPLIIENPFVEHCRLNGLCLYRQRPGRFMTSGWTQMLHSKLLNLGK